MNFFFLCKNSLLELKNCEKTNKKYKKKKPFNKKHHVHFLEPVLRFMSTGAGCLVGVRCETPLVCFREGEGAVEE